MDTEKDISPENYTQLTLEALNACPEYIDRIIERINFLNQLYDSNKHDDANKIFEELIMLLEEFVQLMSHIKISIQTNSTKKPSKETEILQIENHFLGILKSLVPAKEKNDIIMLCDLLVYELVDNLVKWKEVAIPKMKQVLEK